MDGQRGSHLQAETQAVGYDGQERQTEAEEAGRRAAGLGPHGQHIMGAVTESGDQHLLAQGPGVRLKRHQIHHMEQIEEKDGDKDLEQIVAMQRITQAYADLCKCSAKAPKL